MTIPDSTALRAVALLLLACLLGVVDPAAGQDGPARAEVRAAVDAMGGESLWRDLGSIRVEGVGHEHALEQSERPEGPWITTYRQFAELRDLAAGRLRRHQEQRGLWSADWQERTTVADREAAALRSGDRWVPARSTQRDEALARLDLSPERVLLTALDAPDLRGAGDTTLQGVPHHVVAFTYGDRPVRLFLNAATRLPTGWAAPSPLGDAFAEMWGDAPTVTLWSDWELEPGGRLYPRQTDVFRLGHPLESEFVTSVAFDVPAPADSFPIPEEARAAFRASAGTGGLASYRPGVSFRGEPEEAVRLGEGVVTIPGVYAASFVLQDDGVVVLDAPMTADWTEAVLEEAARRFPGARVEAVVSTSDAWLHVGGVREYVARGVPVYALDLNVPLLERLVASPRDRAPDSLAKAPRPADLRPVSRRTPIGQGPNRIELIPVRGEGAERMMLAWLPGRRILFASDLLQLQPDGTLWNPVYLREVRDAVEREGLEPETVFALHTPPMPWSRALEMLAGAEEVAEAAGTPSGSAGNGSDPPVVAPGDPSVRGSRLTPGRFVKRLTRVAPDGSEEDLGTLTQWLGPAPDGPPGALLSVQTFRSPDGATVDSSWMSGETLAPIRHRSHNARRVMALDFDGSRVRGSVRPADGEEERIDQALDPPTFDSNVADLVVSALPLAEGYRARVPTYVYERGGRVWSDVEVEGVEEVSAGGRTVEAWKVRAGSGGSTRYWIARDDRRVVRSEYRLDDGTRFVFTLAR